MVKALAEFGLDGNFPEVPLTSIHRWKSAWPSSR